MPKLFSSTFFCARSMLWFIIGDSIISPSLKPRRSMTRAIFSEAKRRISLSSSDTKNTDEPGSP